MTGSGVSWISRFNDQFERVLCQKFNLVRAEQDQSSSKGNYQKLEDMDQESSSEVDF